jgi:hypothetical protein
MALRYVVGGSDMPALAANRIQTYCHKICETLWDESASTIAFKKGIEVVDAALNSAPLTRDLVKTQTFTDAVRVALGLPSKSGRN